MSNIDQSDGGVDRHPHKPTPIHLREVRGDLVIQEFKPAMRRDGRKAVVDAEDRPLYHLLMEVIDEVDAHCPDLMPAAFAQYCRDLLHVKRKLEDIERGSVWIPDYAQYGMSYCHNVRDAIMEWRADRDPLQFVIVGCSNSKHDVDEAVPIRELYRGAYWSVKRDYGETIGDQWRVLSAKHGLVDPSTPVEHYDRHIGELEHAPVHADETDRLPDGRHVETLLDSWAVDVYNVLRRWLIYAGQHGSVDPRDVELDVLLGRDYCDALAERGVWDRLRARGALDISFPFQEAEAAAGGNGNQMGWMTDEIEAATAVATDGGEARAE